MTGPDRSAAADGVYELYGSDPAARALGITVEAVEAGHVRLRMPVTDAMCNGHGIAHGGYVFALADTAAAYAFRAGGRAGVSTHASVDFLAPAGSGQALTASADERHRGDSNGIYDVSVEADDGRLIAEVRIHGRVPRSGVTPAGSSPVREQILRVDPVRIEVREAVAHLTIDHPPVNCLSRPVRTALLDALESAEYDPSIAAVVLSGGPALFSAGADLAEFDNGEGLAEPNLHLTIAGFLDAMSKPVVAAIGGVALGGGLELALACHYRMSSTTAELGLPETTLGFMPGAGGTQRLPRAVGMELASNLILSGRRIDGAEAHGAGLVDAVTDEDPVGAAHAFAVRVAADRPLPRLRDRALDRLTAEPLLACIARATPRGPLATPGAPFVVQALKAALGPFDAGLAREFQLFRELAESVEAGAFRYRFRTDRRAGRVPAPQPPPISAAAVVGAGTMGRGIALALLAAGITTRVVEADPARLREAVSAINADLSRAAARGRLTADEVAGRTDRLSGVTDLGELGDAEVVIEAIFEDLAAKRRLFEELDRVVRPETVLASNTSSLDLNQIAGATTRPERVVGLHFFSPANVMRLVELIQGRATSTEVLARAAGLVRQLGKIGVIAQVGDGFIGNRMMDQYVRQAMVALATGVPPERIDNALSGWGMAMGPFAVLDVVGNDIPWQARRSRYGTESGGSEWDLADEVYQRGWLGRKSGRGWYDYTDRGPGSPNPELATLLAERVATYRGPAVTDLEIVQRGVYALVNEGAAVLADGIAASPGDIDVVFRNGYGFPSSRGGPMFYADTVGLDRVVRAMRRFAAAGDRFFEPHPLLVEYARKGSKISEIAGR
ncbi:MAG: 3-hydroxyacyl-CoA dehydrogenase [Micromonosporaceae bacterium]|jgi:3-hydroxyacyl-CoA dehydrogenase|nr:3-hydroxyacyl-CoA dehydrogenase [Micromonosporaceae bacterium]